MTANRLRIDVDDRNESLRERRWIEVRDRDVNAAIVDRPRQECLVVRRSSRNEADRSFSIRPKV